MKKILTLSFLILGAFIGASFSSGREIYVYFASFGWCCIPIALIVGVVLYFVMCFFLNFPLPQNKSKTFKIFETILLVAVFVLSSTMFAGCAELSFDFGGIILLIITFSISILQCFVDINGLKIINYILLPLIFVSLIICVSITGFGFNNSSNFLASIFGGVKYIGTNSILLSIFLMQIGDEYSKKEKKIASIIVAAILTVFVVIISLVLMGQPDAIKMSSMPLVTLAFSKNLFFGKVLCMVVWFGLITTLLSGQYVLCNYVKNNTLCKIVLVFISCGFSLLGWGILTTKIYSIVGIVSIFAVAFLMISNIKRGNKTHIFWYKNTK